MKRQTSIGREATPETRPQSSKASSAAFYFLLALIALLFIIGPMGLPAKAFGLLLTALALAVPSRLTNILKTEIETAEPTYDTVIEPIQSLPEFQIPPRPDKQAKLKFGCAPLLDCAIPALFAQLDPGAWESVRKSHAIDIEINITEFGNLLQSVTTNENDIVIGSAAALDKILYDGPGRLKRKENTPKCLLPALQSFNAYYIFGSNIDLDLVLQQHAPSIMKQVRTSYDSGESVHRSLETATNYVGARFNSIINILESADFLVETGADLQYAAVKYWHDLAGESNGQLNIKARRGAANSIARSFEDFLGTSDRPIVYMGGIAQAAYLLEHRQEYILLAGPHDIRHENFNSFICAPDYDLTHEREIMRLFAWWFDIVNRFRRQYLFDSAGSEQLMNLINSDNPLNLPMPRRIVPKNMGPAALEKLFDFIRIRTSDQIGSYLFPNMCEAAHMDQPILRALRRDEAVREFVVRSEKAMDHANESNSRSARAASD